MALGFRPWNIHHAYAMGLGAFVSGRLGGLHDCLGCLRDGFLVDREVTNHIESPRHAFVFAHQDDELGSGGTVSRLAWKHGRFLWVTNGDGLAPMEGVTDRVFRNELHASGDETGTAIPRFLDVTADAGGDQPR